MNARPKPTCDQSRWETDVGGDIWPLCMGVLGAFYDWEKEEGVLTICHIRVLM